MSIIRNEFLQTYKFKILQIFYDILWTMVMPIQLWSISYDTEYIVGFIKKITTNNTKIGLTCIFSDFHGEDLLESEMDYYGSLLEERDKEEFNKKLKFSIEMFIDMYPEALNNITQSTQINVI